MKNVVILSLALALAACSRKTESSAPGADPVVPKMAVEALPPAQISGETYRILGPFAHENLSIFLIQKPGVRRDDLGCITLEEALKSGAVKVAEKADGAEVNSLQIENAGDRPVYLQAGDTVKGGKQDRTIAVDFVLPPKSGKTTVDAFCVEPGRWSVREASATGSARLDGAYFEFESADAPLATREQKLAARLTKSQSDVWTAGASANGQLASSAGLSGVFDSFALASEQPEVKKKVSEYVDALAGILERKDDLVGMAYAVNGEVSTVDIYGTSGLFLKLWAKLLRAAALESLAKKSDKPPAKSAAVSDVAALLDAAGKSGGRVENRAANVRLKVYEGKKAVLFDTEREGEILHRQVINR